MPALSERAFRGEPSIYPVNSASARAATSVAGLDLPTVQPEPAQQPVVAALVYARRPDGSVLLIQRQRPPFARQWAAPGGKIDGVEAPAETAKRGFHDDTGLTALDLELRGVVREVSPRHDFDWLLFLYRCRAAGCHDGDGPDREMRWWARHELEQAGLPDADRWWLPRVLAEDTPLLEATIRFDARLEIVGIDQQRR